MEAKINTPVVNCGINSTEKLRNAQLYANKEWKTLSSSKSLCQIVTCVLSIWKYAICVVVSAEFSA